MTNIDKMLSANGLEVADLPTKLKNAVNKFNKQVASYEEIKANAGDDAENDEEIADLKEYLSDFQEEILESLNEWNEERLESLKAQEAATEPTPEPTPKPQMAQEAQPQQEVVAQEPKEDKKVGFGAFILGIGVLALTLGAVNTFNKR